MKHFRTMAVGMAALIVTAAGGAPASAFPLSLASGAAVTAGPEEPAQEEGQRPDEKETKRGKGQLRSNDHFETATEVEGLPFAESADSSGAGIEAGEPQACATGATIWYTVTARRDVNLTASVNSGFAPVLAVYAGRSLDSLAPVGCVASDSFAELSFAAEAGQSYALQVGGRDGGAGPLDLGIDVADPAAPIFGEPDPLRPGWSEDVLLEKDAIVLKKGEGASLPLASIHGAPAEDPAYYDLAIAVAGRQLPALSLYTAGKVKQEIHEELVTLLDQGTDLSLRVSRRYVQEKTQCAAYAAGTCVATVPVDPDDPSWTLDGGESTELIVRISTHVDGRSIDQTLRIPYVGQLGTLVP